jgi:hypothetical protein
MEGNHKNVRLAMIYPQEISDSRKAFAEFRKITSLSHFLRLRERIYWWFFFAIYYLTWVVIAWVLHRFSRLPGTYFPLPTLDASVSRQIFEWLICLIYAALPATPLLLLYVRLRSLVIKKSLSRRGIEVSGWDWRGAEVERRILDQFKSYLGSHGLHNLESVMVLMENVRDETTADLRPLLGSWTVLAISCAIAIAFWQAMFSQWLEKFAKENSGLIGQLGLLGFVGTILFFGIIIPFLVFPIRSRTPREIYLHSLTAIKLELLKWY